MADPTARRLSRIYTLLLFVCGGGSLALVAGMSYAAGLGLPPQERGVLALGSELHLVFGVAAVWVALLRQFKGASALPASRVLSVALALEFPFGTALFLYWLLRVRGQESQPPSRHKAVGRYTTGLFIAAFGFLISGLTFGALPPAGADDLFGILAKVYVGLGLLLAIVGTVRCLNLRWGHDCTFALSVLLLPLLPIGTIASFLWFAVVRQQERELLSEATPAALVAEFE